MAAFLKKLAFITGGSSGIGLETAMALSSRGCSVVLFARGQAGLEEASKKVAAKAMDASQRFGAISMDVSDNGQVIETIESAVDKFGVPDILINSAGIGYGNYFERISYERFDQVIKINLYGTRNTISAVLPFMKQRGSGHIVNLSSVAGLIGIFGYSLYSASKYALVGFSESLRSELKRQNIVVTVVCPPEVRTPLIEEEAKTMPPESRAVKNMAGLLEPVQVARVLVRAIVRKRFLVVPGLRAKATVFLHRISNGRLSRMTSDWVVALAARKALQEHRRGGG